MSIEPNGSLCGCDLLANPFWLDGERLSSRPLIKQRWCQPKRVTYPVFIGFRYDGSENGGEGFLSEPEDFRS